MAKHVTRREFNLLQKLLNERHQAQQQGVSAALSAAKEAVNKSEKTADKRFDTQNEWRGQLSDQAATFLRRDEYRTAHDALIEKMETATGARAKETADVDRRMTAAHQELEKRVNALVEGQAGAEKARSQARDTQRLLLTIMGVMLTVLTLVFAFYVGTH